ncbi:MAG: hypothetical protein ACK52S_01050 [Pirellula sp.]
MSVSVGDTHEITEIKPRAAMIVPFLRKILTSDSPVNLRNLGANHVFLQ